MDEFDQLQEALVNTFTDIYRSIGEKHKEELNQLLINDIFDEQALDQ